MTQAGTRPREFLYVDVQRVKSLLAHMDGGLLEQITSGGSNAVNAEAQASIFGIGGSGGYSHDWTSEEQRSMHDVTFSLFEDAADRNGYVTEIAGDFFEPARWADGSVQATLEPAQIVRITCDVQMLDGGLFTSRVARLVDMVDALVNMRNPETVPAQAAQRPGLSRAAADKQRTELVEAERAKILGGTSVAAIESISKFVTSFLGSGVAMRALPCGSDFLEFGFSGSLLGRADYMQEEREHLFSRYGTTMSSWTCVLQVAAVPVQGTSRTKMDPASAASLLLQPDIVSRAATERIAGQVLNIMESIGVVDGPRWPTVSVTPLGVYRDVPTVSQ